MNEEQHRTFSTEASQENPDWDRTPTEGEEQATARHNNPDDLGTTSPTENSISAGGDATDIGPSEDGAGGTPYTSGYVTGGAHHPTIADLPREKDR